MAGVIWRLEESFNHPLQWLVCLLHANELLPLQHLFETLDRATTGRREFSGSIEKQLATCTQQPVSYFEAVKLTKDLFKAAFTRATFLQRDSKIFYA